VGAVPGTKFTWPATGIASVDENLLTPGKEILFKKYLDIYRVKMLSKGKYRGDLYDIGYDLPETHCIQRGDTLYYSFFNNHFKGRVELKGLVPNQSYSVFDYVNNKSLGKVKEGAAKISVDFTNSLLIEVKPIP
jgi:alpha-galactosidase